MPCLYYMHYYIAISCKSCKYEVYLQELRAWTDREAIFKMSASYIMLNDKKWSIKNSNAKSKFERTARL